MKRTRRGFTLVELLIVVAIIGVLATMMSLSAGNSTAKATAAKVIADFRTLRSAVGIFMAESGDADGDPLTRFNKVSNDYIGGKLKKFSISSSDTGWTATYSETLTNNVLAAMTDSSDVGIGGSNGALTMKVY